jgi:hypothetical protein
MMALSVPRADVWAQKDYLQIVSIDPAVVNLALRIERRYTNRPPEVVHFDKVTLTDDPEVPLALALHTWLMTLDHEFSESHVFLIENQLRQNPWATRVDGHLCAFFLARYAGRGLHPLVAEVSPKLKSKQLNAPKGEDLKKWSVEKATAILTERGDVTSLAILDGFKKKDDLADVICQSESWCQKFLKPETLIVTF